MKVIPQVRSRNMNRLVLLYIILSILELTKEKKKAYRNLMVSKKLSIKFT